MRKIIIGLPVLPVLPVVPVVSLRKSALSICANLRELLLLRLHAVPMVYNNYLSKSFQQIIKFTIE
jgi:hypothetical protein